MHTESNRAYRRFPQNEKQESPFLTKCKKVQNIKNVQHKKCFRKLLTSLDYRDSIYMDYRNSQEELCWKSCLTQSLS